MKMFQVLSLIYIYKKEKDMAYPLKNMPCP